MCKYANVKICELILSQVAIDIQQTLTIRHCRLMVNF